MEYVAVAFRLRSETVAFSRFLSKNGIMNEIVNTPKSAGVGCGLSVKVPPSMFMAVKRALFSVSTKSFAGFFLVSLKRGEVSVKTL